MIFLNEELYFVKNKKGYLPFVYKAGENFIINALNNNKIENAEINESQSPELCIKKIYNSHLAEDIEVIKYETVRKLAHAEEKWPLGLSKSLTEIYVTQENLEILTNALNKQLNSKKHKTETEQEYNK